MQNWHIPDERHHPVGRASFAPVAIHRLAQYANIE
jgi:hypothetical protein